MSDILASVSVVLGAEISGFRAAMATARKELKGLVQFSEGLKDIGSSLTTYVSAPLALLGAASVAASGKVESLKKGLEAITLQELGKQGVTGLGALQEAAQLTTQRMSQLEQIAKQPGLGFEGAVQGDVRLRAVGISAEQSAKSIKAFANAIATTGGGKSEFDRVTVQLAQLSAKGKVLAQDLRPIIEAAPSVAAALQNLYGTVDSETISASLEKQGQSSKDFIRILTDELAKLPQVGGGLKNAFENLADTTTLALAKVGDAISKSLNLPGLLEGVSGAITSFGSEVASLPAPVQAAVVALAGLAAATGPVLLGLGTLGLAIPNIKAGFAALQSATTLLQTNMVQLRGALAAVLSPTGAIIAVAVTLAAVIYAANTESQRAYEAFHKQAEATRQLDTALTPLLDRYDELKSKTSLSTAEQEELRSVVQKVTAIMPEAGTKIDEYGNFIDIAAEKARKSIAVFQGLDKAFALRSLPQARAELKDLESSYATLQRAAQQVNDKGTLNGVALSSLGSTAAENIGRLRDDIAQVGAELEKQRAKVKDFEAAAGQLADTLNSGLSPALTEAELALKFLGGQGKEATGLLAGLHEQLKQLKQEQQDAPTEKLALAYIPLIKNLQDYIAKLEGSGKASREAADALAKLRKELTDNANASRALGDLYDYNGGRAKVLESGIKSLTDAGFAPGSKVVQQYVAQLRAVPQALDQLALRTVKGTEKLFETPEFELPKLPELPEIKLTPIDAAPFTASINNATAELARFQKVAEDFSDGLNQVLVQGMGNIAVGFGEAIGNILAGATGLDGLGAAILAPVGEMIVQLGQLAIAAGIGIEAIKKALETLNPVVAIGAGIALVAIGSAIKGAASNIASGSGGGVASSAVSSPKVQNYGQNSNQATIKVLAEFRLRGQDLVALGRQQTFRSKITD